jgi:RimJ/RimL family protein N-acetyltransferase
VTSFLETERLVLRRFTESDIDLLVELNADPDVMWFLTGVAGRSPDGRR